MGMRSVVFAGIVILAGPALADDFNSMKGAYFGALGGYQFDPQHRDDPEPFSLNPMSPAARGGTIGGVIGYNRSLGSTFLGVEGRGGYNLASRSIGASDPGYQTTFPIFVGAVYLCSCDVHALPPDPNPDFAYSSSSSVIRKTKAGANGDISLRIGVIEFAGVVTYARLGVGAQKFTATRTTVTRSANCRSPVRVRTYTGNSFVENITGCGSFDNTISVDASSKSVTTPYLDIGLGAERNIGSFFGRGEVELIDYLGSASGSVLAFNQFYEIKATVGIGYRFR